MLWVQVLFWKYMVAKILLPVCDMSFHYLDSEDKFWFWWCSILPIYSFMDHALDVLSRKFCLTQGHKGFFPMFSPRSFKYLGFTFMFMVHFEVMNMGGGLKFIFEVLNMQSFQQYFLKRPSLLYWKRCLCIFIKTICPHICALTFGFLFCSTDCFFCLYTSIIVFWSPWLYTEFWSQVVLAVNFCSSRLFWCHS